MNKQLTIGILMSTVALGVLELTGNTPGPVNVVMFFAAFAGVGLIVIGAMKR